MDVITEGYEGPNIVTQGFGTESISTGPWPPAVDPDRAYVLPSPGALPPGGVDPDRAVVIPLAAVPLSPRPDGPALLIPLSGPARVFSLPPLRGVFTSR